MKTINVREARLHLAEVLVEAQAEPVVLTKHGRPIAILLGTEHGEAKRLQRSLNNLLLDEAKPETLKAQKRRRGRA